MFVDAVADFDGFPEQYPAPQFFSFSSAVPCSVSPLCTALPRLKPANMFFQKPHSYVRPINTELVLHDELALKPMCDLGDQISFRISGETKRTLTLVSTPSSLLELNGPWSWANTPSLISETNPFCFFAGAARAVARD